MNTRHCAIVLMDATPLIYFGAVGELKLLLKLNLPLWIPDEVLFEATAKYEWKHGRPGIGAEAISKFVAVERKAGRVNVVETYTGASATRDRKSGILKPEIYPPGLGEQAAHSVYLNTSKTERPALFMYNDEDAAQLLRTRRLDIHLLTPYSFLVALEKERMIESADVVWSEIEGVFANITKNVVDESLRGDTGFKLKRVAP
jgi:hypothetical protein